MSLEADMLVDRRRMRRKLTFWRISAFVILAVGLTAAIIVASDYGEFSKRQSHIARLAIDGVIVENRKQLQLIDKIGESSAVRGVIVSINSPGGSTTGGEALYEALRALAEKKPVVSEIRTVGASAGYMVALSSDHIIARYNSITGSIGVLFQYGNIAKLLDTVGVEVDAVKSAPLKAAPDFYSQSDPDALAMLNTLVSDSYDWFVDLVKERRGLSAAQARTLSDGRIYSGHAAQENGLIDAIGGEKAAVQWLESERSVEKDLPVLNWSVLQDQDGLPISVKMTQGIGSGLANGLIERLNLSKWLISPAIMLDGLVSVWQAPGAAQEESSSRGGGQ